MYRFPSKKWHYRPQRCVCVWGGGDSTRLLYCDEHVPSSLLLVKIGHGTTFRETQLFASKPYHILLNTFRDRIES